MMSYKPTIALQQLRMATSRNPLFLLLITVQIAALAMLYSPTMWSEAILVFYLLIVPGVIVKQYISSSGENILILPLSASVLMVAGFIANAIHPEPFSQPLFKFAFWGICFTATLPLRKGMRKHNLNIEINKLDIFAGVNLCLSILGVYFVNRDGENIILLSSLLFISIILILITRLDYNKRLLLWLLSLTLLLQSSLIVNYLTMGDAITEYYVANLTLQNGSWNPEFSRGKNGMLSVAILPPVVSYFSGLDLIYYYRIVYPVIFSVFPIVLYDLYKQHFNVDTAVVTVITFLHYPLFFELLANNTRTGLALLFLASYLYCISKSNSRNNLNVCSIIFISSVVVSHYGVSYLVILLLSPALVFLWFHEWILGKGVRQIKIESLARTLALFGVIISTWYYLTTSGRLFEIPANKAYINITSFILNQGSSAVGKTTAQANPSLSIAVSNYSQMLVIFLSVVGVATFYFRHLYISILDRNHEIDSDAIYFALGGGLVMSIIILPIRSLSLIRIYSVASIVILPYYFKLLKKVLNDKAIIAVLVSLSVIFAFSSGLVAATLTHDESNQMNMQNKQIIESGDNEKIHELYKTYARDTDYSASHWLFEYKDEETNVHGSTGNMRWLSNFFFTGYDRSRPPGPYQPLNISEAKITSSYIYTSSYTGFQGVVISSKNPDNYQDSSKISLEYISHNCNKMYTTRESSNFKC